MEFSSSWLSKPISMLVEELSLCAQDVRPSDALLSTLLPTTAMQDNGNALLLLSIRSFAALVELSGGQPLDRWKMNLQLPPGQRIPFNQLVSMGPKEWYTASWTSMTQRVFFYIPCIYFANDYFNHNVGDDTIAKNIGKAAFVSSIVTPGSTWFENLKTKQQVGGAKYSGLSMLGISSKIYREEGFRKLFRTMSACFAREFMFSGGLCCVAPFYHKLLKERGVESQFVAGACAGVTSQLLSQPFDTLKSWQEVNSVSSRTAVAQISPHGVSFLWRGSVPRALRGAWTLGCLTYVTSFLNGVFIESRIESHTVPVGPLR